MKFKSLKSVIPLGLLAAISIAGNASAATFLIDFGLNNAQGSTTSSPDTNGNTWNNIYSNAAAGNNTGGTGTSTGLSNLVSTANSGSSISLALINGTGAWSVSGGTGFGGLMNPSAALLGDFAVATATQDYFFTSGGGTASILISGLDQSMTYDFSFFATRNTTETRTTLYTITDNIGIHTVTLQTSGAGIGTNSAEYPTGQPNGNDDEIVSLTGMVPNSSGELNFMLSNVNGGFSYIGAMEITSVPEPTAALLGGLAAFGFAFTRRRCVG